MLSKETKLRLVHAVTDQKVADEIEKRLIDTTPVNPTASEAVLAELDESMDKNIEERMVIALAGDDRGAAGRELAKKLVAMTKVLAAHADGDEVAGSPAEAAIFSGQVAGMTTDIELEADVAGANGNLITLTFDGLDDVDAAILTWNTANPANTVSLISGDGSQVPDNGETIALSGGADAVAASDANTAAEQAKMGSEPMSAKTFECLVAALADRKAAEEMKAAYNAMIAAVQAITP